MFGEGKPCPYLDTPAGETDASFSPDGRWVAYQSADRGRTDVYVQPFPATGRIFQISRRGGAKPVWRYDGTELFFIGSGGRMMAVRVDATDTFRVGTPTELFTVSTRALAGLGSQYAVSRDGQRFSSMWSSSGVRRRRSPFSPIGYR